MRFEPQKLAALLAGGAALAPSAYGGVTPETLDPFGITSLPVRHGGTLASAPATIKFSGGTTRIADSNGRDPWGNQARDVVVPAFELDATPVTVGDFLKFTQDYEAKYGVPYITVAEEAGASYVYDVSTREFLMVSGANFLHPEGPSGRGASENEPVTQLAIEDALVYAEFYGKRLPSYAELQYATFGSRPASRFPWGNDAMVNGKPQGNIWHMKGTDGYDLRSPVGSFAPSAKGVYDLVGNVCQLTSDNLKDGKYLAFGAAWSTLESEADLRAWGKVAAGTPSNITGFRCVEGHSFRLPRYHIPPEQRPEAGPRRIVIDLSEQTLYYYENKKLVLETPATTGITREEAPRGFRGGPTPSGSFRITDKEANAISEKYGNTPMPHFLRLTSSGIGIHGCNTTAKEADLGRPLETIGKAGEIGSHGCIRIHRSVASWLFRRVKSGDLVEVRR